jgi:hypothetical protein
MTGMIVKGFGSAPIRREGQAVSYDTTEEIEINIKAEYELDISFDPKEVIDIEEWEE